MLFEISNPSDAYTIEAETLVVAGVATLLLGEGKYGLSGVDDAEAGMPIFLFGGHEQWLATQGVPNLDAFLDANYASLAEALESVTIGSAEERKRLGRIVAVITNEEERAKARAAWHDERRSSLNDIGKRAGGLAKRLRELADAAGKLRP